jgi:hypothetical protein
MVVWALTAGIGVYLLAAVIAAQRHEAAGPSGTSQSPASGGPSKTSQSPASGPSAKASQSPAGAGPTASGAPGAADTALLEFSHPALALTGLTFWIFFVVTSGRVFAWIALGVVVATVLAGLGWAFSGWRQARAARGHGNATAGPRSAMAGARSVKEEAGLPVRLMLIHGLAAACTLILVVIAAVAAHG